MAVKYAHDEYLVCQQRLSQDTLMWGLALPNRVPFTDKTLRFRFCLPCLLSEDCFFFVSILCTFRKEHKMTYSLEIQAILTWSSFIFLNYLHSYEVKSSVPDNTPHFLSAHFSVLCFITLTSRYVNPCIVLHWNNSEPNIKHSTKQ